MSDIAPLLDTGYDLGYELDETIVADSPARLKACGHPLRSLILDLVLERAMSVTELAERVHKPRGTVTTLDDPEGRATIAEYLKDLPARVYPIGRLDFHTDSYTLRVSELDRLRTI